DLRGPGTWGLCDLPRTVWSAAVRLRGVDATRLVVFSPPSHPLNQWAGASQRRFPFAPLPLARSLWTAVNGLHGRVYRSLRVQACRRQNMSYPWQDDAR